MRRFPPPGKSRMKDSFTPRHMACSSSAMKRLSSPISISAPGMPAIQSCGVSMVLSFPVRPIDEMAAPAAPLIDSSFSRGPHDSMLKCV